MEADSGKGYVVLRKNMYRHAKQGIEWALAPRDVGKRGRFCGQHTGRALKVHLNQRLLGRWC